ncbi:MAG: deoxyribodipyrimidine photo-lyase [Arenicella sp.]|jgi:deoxyribodipyrimidine photo-lyase
MNTLVWLREDLRLFDNPALHHAASMGEVTPVYIFPEGLGGASYWWLHHSLKALQASLAEQGVRLILRTGDPVQVLEVLCEQAQATSVVWNRVYSPEGIAVGAALKERLKHANIESTSFNAQLLIEPTQVLNKQGTPFKVFTPFWRHCMSRLEPTPLLDSPIFLKTTHSIESEPLSSWGLLPTTPDWSTGFDARWSPGEAGAQHKWQIFTEGTISRYKDGRDIPIEENTSMLSPHLAFGEISPKQIWFEIHQAIACREIDADNGHKFLAEIGWREYSRYLLVHFPHIISEPFNAKFADFPWQDDAKLLSAWQRGQTGYPIVDAGMRELWATGYMHNRVRMITASFLTKHCLTHWKEGMAWFWDTLVDADIGNNTASWQWVAGSGADASPYFRIFNPILQGDKFDKEGAYIKKWVPELAKLDKKFINKPWEADPMSLQLAGITLGQHYPLPIVDHKQAREAALAAYKSSKKA